MSGFVSQKTLAARASSAKAKSPAGKAKAKEAKLKAAKKAERRDRPSTPAKSSRLWESLQHMGVLFPPAYEPHGVKMRYDNQPVDLSPAEEEVASMFAVMKDTDYATKPVFVKNFWKDFVGVLSPENARLMKDIAKCDFTPIYLHLLEVRPPRLRQVRCRGGRCLQASAKAIPGAPPPSHQRARCFSH